MVVLRRVGHGLALPDDVVARSGERHLRLAGRQEPCGRLEGGDEAPYQDGSERQAGEKDCPGEPIPAQPRDPRRRDHVNDGYSA